MMITTTLSVLNYLAIAFMITASAAGIFDPQAYARESLTWGAQGMGQDFVNLFIISPLMLISFNAAVKGGRKAYIIWLGLIIYTVYSYVLYSFAMHFNRYFLVYCAALGTSFFAFLSAFRNTDYESFRKSFGGAAFKAAPAVLIVSAVIFALLWLKEAVPASVSNTIPKTVSDAGLMINPVHVNDLALLLPAFIASGIMLLNKKAEGYVFVPAMLVFSVFMDVAIIGMSVMMNVKGAQDAGGVIYIMGIFAVISAVVVALMLGKLKEIPQEKAELNVI